MFTKRSPPNQKYTKLTSGGSTNVRSSSPTTATATNVVPSCSTAARLTASTQSFYSNSSKSGLLSTNYEKHHMHYHHSHGHAHHGVGGGSSRSSSLSGSSLKRNKKHNWGTRERTGMSFLIVIAFFAIFGLIILTEVFMIDERSRGGVVVHGHGGSYGGRMGDSMPDYDNVKDDYDLLDGNLLTDNKLGFVQFRDNKLKIQDAENGDAGRLAGVLVNSGVNGLGAAVGSGGIGAGANSPLIPWGKVLPSKVEDTLPPYPAGTTPTDGSWQVVNGTRFKFFVFSAYYDRRDGRLVRIIGATKTRGPERVWCRFWYGNRNGSATAEPARFTSATVMARVKIIRENWNLKYSACFILCPVRAPEVEVPQYVSVVSRLRSPPGNVLQLRNTDWDHDFAATGRTSNASAVPVPPPTGDRIADRIAVCVKPFHFNYDQALYLMEYLEFYALLGVSHFTFYNHTIGPHTNCVLQHYMRGDVPGTLPVKTEAASGNHSSSNSSAPTKPPSITMLPWNLRMRSQKEIRTEGLFAALNDCLYRTMYRFKYLALVDLDEFIVPRHNDTLSELIGSLNNRFRSRNTGVYSFQNAFFYLQFPDDPVVYQHGNSALNERLRVALVTQRKTRRRFKLHPQKQRSKYICKPEAVVEAGNHFVWEFSPGKGSLNVPPTDAILQHYRVCEFGGNDCIKAPSVIDRTATKYGDQLVQRVEAVYNYLKQRCELPELPFLGTKQPPSSKGSDRTTKTTNRLNERTETKASNEAQRDGKTNGMAMATAVAASTAITTKTTITNRNAQLPNATATLTNATAIANAKNEASKSAVKPGKIKKRKMIVFEEDEEGYPCARVEYTYV